MNKSARGRGQVADEVVDEARRAVVIWVSLFVGWGFVNMAIVREPDVMQSLGCARVAVMCCRG